MIPLDLEDVDLDPIAAFELSLWSCVAECWYRPRCPDCGAQWLPVLAGNFALPTREHQETCPTA